MGEDAFDGDGLWSSRWWRSRKTLNLLQGGNGEDLLVDVLWLLPVDRAK